MKPFTTLILVLVIFSSFVGCGGNVIEEDKFVSMYTEYLLAQDALGSSKKASDKIVEALSKKYNTTPEDYVATVEYLSENQERWNNFFDKVEKKLTEEQSKYSSY